MRVLSVERSTAICEAGGLRHSVSLFLLQHEKVVPGQWLAVDRGFALAVNNDAPCLAAEPVP